MQISDDVHGYLENGGTAVIGRERVLFVLGVIRFMSEGILYRKTVNFNVVKCHSSSAFVALGEFETFLQVAGEIIVNIRKSSFLGLFSFIYFVIIVRAISLKLLSYN